MTARDDDDGEPEALRDGERAEHEWLMARDADPGVRPPSPAIARDYNKLEHMLATLPADQDDTWQTGLLDRIRAAPAAANAASVTPLSPRRKRTLLWFGASMAIAAAFLLVVLIPRGSEQQTTDGEAISLLAPRSGAAVRGDNTTYSVGETLISTEAPLAAELRLYAPDGTLLAKCPGQVGCVRDGDRQHLQLALPQRGHYLVIRTEQQHPELSESRDDYREALMKTHIDASSKAFTVD